MDLININIRDVLARAGNKQIRVATKSIRCRYILDHVLKSNPRFNGLMCYTAGEAVWLANSGFDNLLIGYPSMNEAELTLCADQVARGKKIYPMVDSIQQARLLSKIAVSKGIRFTVCLDIDMSTDFPRIHFGVYRSPLHYLADVQLLVAELGKLEGIQISGLMGYEAQVAGLGDHVKGGTLKNSVVRRLQKKSNKDYKKRREEIVNWVKGQGIQLDLVNAGGTGSLELSSSEPWVTEVTAGSGFYSPGLFDYYSHFKHMPAAGFMLQIVRQPKPTYYTCLGGGYIASGGIGTIKQPYPYLPEGMKMIKDEGFGEVQTPFTYHGPVSLAIGDPVIFRHAKAGELCEHFNELEIIQNDGLATSVPTYRGEGKVFL